MENVFSEYCLNITIVLVIPSTTDAYKSFVCILAHSVPEGCREG